MKVLASILVIITMTMIILIICLSKQVSKSYVNGYKDGFKYVLNELISAKEEAMNSCVVVALPVIREEKQDTVVYFLTSKLCDQLDTVITDRFKRGN